MGKVNIGTMYSSLSHISPNTIPGSASHILNNSHSIVSVFMVCNMIVSVELLISHIFKGTLEVCHSE